VKKLKDNKYPSMKQSEERKKMMERRQLMLCIAFAMIAGVVPFASATTSPQGGWDYPVLLSAPWT
jgi:hypothetical protein